LAPGTFALFAKRHCGITLPGSPDAEDFWARASAHPDVVVVDREAGLVKLADVAPIRERAVFSATQGFRRLFLLDRCERLSLPSANAILKVLEEPSAPCLFLFTARSVRSVLPTITSRCQRVAVRFGDSQTPSPLDALEPPDAAALRAHFASTPSAGSPSQSPPFSPVSRGSDFSLEAQAPRPTGARLRRVIELADALAKKYEAELLADACLQAGLEAHAASPVGMTLSSLRLVKEDARAWRDGLAYNPSASLWMCRILLRP